MKLQLDNPPFEPGFKLKHTDQLFFIGSCFSDTMSVYFEERKFSVAKNPFGVLYNPVSIADSIEQITSEKEYKVDTFNHHNDFYASWHHHSNLSEMDADDLKQKLDNINVANHAVLKKTDVIFITLGTAWAYKLLSKGIIAANNHQLPPQHFEQVFLSVSEIVEQLQRMISLLKKANSTIKIVFTLSPVRHSKQGLVANNLSKACLLSAIHEVIDQAENVVYLPTYELVIDVLRDYRFYQKDLVHPNETATDYIWEYLMSTFIADEDTALLNELYQLTLSTQHKIRHRNSTASARFVSQQINNIKRLKAEKAYLDLSAELDHFSNL